MKRLPTSLVVFFLLVCFVAGYLSGRQDKKLSQQGHPLPQMTEQLSVSYPDPAVSTGKNFTRLKLDRVVTRESGGLPQQLGNNWVITYWCGEGDEKKQVAYVFSPLP